MAGGAQPCNVNWWVAQAATLTVDNGASTPFQGNLLAGAAATATGTAGAPTALTVTGRIWAAAGITVKNSTINGYASAIAVPGPRCKQGEDENSDQSKDSEDLSATVNDAAETSDQSGRDSKDENSKQDGDHGKKGCDSHDSEKDQSGKDTGD